MKGTIEENFAEALQLAQAIQSGELIERTAKAAEIIAEVLRRGNKVLVAGNGGSAADAQHLVAELVGRFQKERKGFPAVALTTNTSLLTALANDYSFEMVFARQVETLGQKGDVFVGISTSGNSANIVAALETAKKIGIFSICLLGRDGGKCAPLCDLPIVVPHHKTARIQEVHILTIHAICDAVETVLTEGNGK